MSRSSRRPLLTIALVAGCQSPTSTFAPSSPNRDHAQDQDQTQAEGHRSEGHRSEDVSPSPHADQVETEHHRHHRFVDAERWAERFDAPSRDRWQRPEAVLDFIAPNADAIIADLGAGTGYFTVRFARRAPRGRIFATDIESDMVRYVSERALKEGLDHVTAVRGTMDDPGLPEAVDVAFMCNVVHHLPHRVEFFRRVVTQLRPGGRVIIVDFKKDAPADIPGPPPAIRIAHDALIAELAAAGLAPVRIERELLPYQYVIEFAPSSP